MEFRGGAERCATTKEQQIIAIDPQMIHRVVCRAFIGVTASYEGVATRGPFQIPTVSMVESRESCNLWTYDWGFRATKNTVWWKQDTCRYRVS